MPATGSIWLDGVRRPRFAPLDQDIDADYVVAGAGITGLTTAFLLANQGLNVVVLEAEQVASGTTAASSAHVTEVPDEGYRGLLRRVGESSARALVERSADALQLIGELADGVNCDFLRVPAYLFTERVDERPHLEDECRAASQLGQRCELTATVPLPWSVHAGVCFPDQVALQPVRYLIG
jgi:glycine/D-amino acid oxidase-like deaminating enzyme